jgi:hypothetical protein
MREFREKLLIEHLRIKFNNFIFTFPELAVHDLLVASHENIYISAK